MRKKINGCPGLLVNCSVNKPNIFELCALGDANEEWMRSVPSFKESSRGYSTECLSHVIVTPHSLTARGQHNEHIFLSAEDFHICSGDVLSIIFIKKCKSLCKMFSILIFLNLTLITWDICTFEMYLSHCISIFFS